MKCMLENRVVFYLKNGRDLISPNLLHLREDFLESSLNKYELAGEYKRNSEESIVYRIHAKFDKLIADAIKNFRQYPIVKSFKIIKHGGFMGAGLFAPECNCCGENMMRIEAEIITKIKRKKEIANADLFYFCDYCGTVAKVKMGIKS